jgi:Acetoacetate decarboxylase (ADC)
MPARGRLAVADALPGAAELESLSPEPWDLPGARILQASFEVAEDVAETAIPPALHPSIPPYATFTVAQFPQSPVGPFHLGQVRIVARAGIRPRGFLVAAVSDSQAAADALSAGWGYACSVGSVTLSMRHDRWIGRVERDGGTLLEVACRDPQVISGSDVDLLDSLHLVRHQGEALIVQVDPEYTYQEASRGGAELPVFVPQSWGGRVFPTSPNVAVTVVADTDLPRPRFVMDPDKLAIEGTRRLESA